MNLLNFSSLQFKDEGGEFEYDPASFYTDEVFSSQEQLMEWAQSTAIPLGYVIVKGRSNKNSAGYTNKVLLMCDRGGVPRDRGSTGVRAAFSKKCNCPFKLQGYFDPPYGWRVNVKEHRHNHLPSENLEGHAYARRLSVDERKWVEQAAQMNNPAYEIFAKLKKKFPNNLSTIKDIYNVVEKIRADAAERLGNTPVQVLLSVLHANHYIYQYTTNVSSNRLENLFFTHPRSLEMWRAFPNVLFIDATYKTNPYGMPFIEIVGVTSTSKTFLIACAFVRNEKEATYKWVLECLKEPLGEGIDVRVIVTDRELSLMNACRDVLPDAARQLCRYHIRKNIINNDEDDDDADDAYIDEGLDDFKRVFKSQPKPVRKNMFRRLMDIIKPSQTQIKEPAVVKNKRGRPSVQKKPSAILPDLNKTPLTKGSPILEKSRSMHYYGAGPRTSMTNYPESQRAPARQSSYMPSVSRFGQEDYSGTSSHFPDPSFHISHSPDMFGEPGTQFMYGTPESRFEIPLSEIPKVFHPYVRRIVNVKGDGNCGFRALAVALGYDDKDSTGLEWVRNEMLAEYDTNKDFYDKVFAMERVHKYVQMSYPKGGRPRVYWMSMPEGPILLANRLGLVINCLSLDESSTLFPFWRGPDSEMYRNQPISIALVHGGCHYVMVELEGKYPMARVNPYWSRRNITSDAARWKDHFKDQLDLYVRLTNSPFKVNPSTKMNPLVI